MNDYLRPTYLEIDFQSAKERIIQLMQQSDTFKDYNYEGANITMLIEMMAYITDMSTYFSNKIVKNIYPESAEVYETMHGVSSIRGYRPKGYIAPQLDFKITVLIDPDDDSVPSPGDQLFIPAWFRIDSGLTTADGDSVYYLTTENITAQIPEDETGESYSFEITTKQGVVETYVFDGDEIFNNKILLPNLSFDYDTIPYDTDPSLQLFVNNEPWTRVDLFPYSYLEDNRNDNIYILEYDKYERYNIIFSPSHNVPQDTDSIQIAINRTIGPAGNISANSINDFIEVMDVPIINVGPEFQYVDHAFITNITKDIVISKDYIEIINERASYNAAIPETLQQIEQNSRSYIYAQFRNITIDDYRMHLEGHPNVIKSTAWGENEQNPGNTTEYNKIYLSCIPTRWDSSTIETSGIDWQRIELADAAEVIQPHTVSESYKDELFVHLEPRKQLNIYEIFVTPCIVHFAFDIGLRLKRTYSFSMVVQELKRKLQYYFSPANRNFNEIIDFKEIHNFLLDLNIRDENNTRFNQIEGILNLVFRDILTYTPNLFSPETIYEPNTDKNNPMYTVNDYEFDYINTLRPIKLGLHQFPMLSSDNCTFINEG